MKFKNHRRNPNKSRRNFIKYTGTFFTGFSVLKPTFALGLNSFKFKPDFLTTVNLQDEKILPEGVKVVWDLSKAYRDTTVSRERICINGLWQWQPGTTESEEIPAGNWGYFKVPGNWPGLSNYLQKESQKMFSHPVWKDKSLNRIDVAWYRREIIVPKNWVDRRIILSMEYVNSSGIVFVDGNRVGEILFPAGELDLTSICIPGYKYTLSIKITALPLQDVVAIYSDSNAPRQGKGAVDRRGLCGDVFLSGTPLEARIENVRVNTSVRKGEITFYVAMGNISPGVRYNLHSIISDKKKIIEFKSGIFSKEDLKDGQISFIGNWLPERLWDIHTPENMFDLSVSLLGKNDLVLDTAFPSRFGFREFWIDGRDFYLNGTRIFLSAVPLDNALVGAGWANYEAAKESMRRLMSFGINFVYTHNYGCEPGTHLSYSEVLKAADDTGMIISLSQPHFGQYDWDVQNADQKNGYAHHAKFYTRVAGNHPSVIFYSMNHNACGYNDDMNPDMIDGLTRPDSQWSAKNVKKALRTEVIVAKLDPDRIIYHHSSGNLSSMHSSNFYPNWVPIQELTDWFEHWATAGVKPLFLCEFGAPFTWDWGLYRGWYKGKREFGSAPVPWEFCLAEWDAQFLGDDAYKISEFEKTNLRWEAKRFQEGSVWQRWDYPYNFDSSVFNERIPVLKMHLTDQWRAFRTWEMSANSPWNYNSYWQLKDGLNERRRNLIVDWENLQRPGFSPDFIERENRMDLDVAFDQTDWIPTAAGALNRNNMPLLMYIGGKSTAFTSKDHNFLPGEKFEKQLIIINNSRSDIICECKWSLNLLTETEGNKTVTLGTGIQYSIPLDLNLPVTILPGNYKINAEVKFSNGEKQEDSFEINVLPNVQPVKADSKIALFDPKGETRTILDKTGLQYKDVESESKLDDFDILVIGKESLTVDGIGLNVENVRKGLKIIMFEQTSEVLEKRFGFRVHEYGLRKVFKRISNHPVFDGLDIVNLHDWQGYSTILPPKLNYEMNENVFNGAPTVKWCDIPVTRIWRCGNRGNVASVLIEKPACGNFLPIVDGGYSLQYSPLMEYREGNGMVLFCQMDVTGRTEEDPAAQRLVRNIFKYASEWKAGIYHQAVYAGDEAGFNHLVNAGVKLRPFDHSNLSSEKVLIVGSGGGKLPALDSKTIEEWIKKGGRVLAIGLDQKDANTLLPLPVSMNKKEHIASFFETFKSDSPFAGIGPSDVHNRSPKELSLVSQGAEIIGNGILANSENASVVFYQMKPWECDFSNGKHNVKQTFRRSSFLLNRLIANMGVESTTPLITRFNSPVDPGNKKQRWLEGFYLDQPEEWDDPYRFFRW